MAVSNMRRTAFVIGKMGEMLAWAAAPRGLSAQGRMVKSLSVCVPSLGRTEEKHARILFCKADGCYHTGREGSLSSLFMMLSFHDACLFMMPCRDFANPGRTEWRGARAGRRPSRRGRNRQSG